MSINCKYCSSANLVKNGLDLEKKQRYKCKDCGKTFIISQRKYTDDFKLEIIKWYLEGVGIRSIGRRMNVSHRMIIYWIKSFSKIMQEKILKASQDIKDPKNIEILELDEFMTICKKKLQKSGYGWLLTETGIKLLTWK